QTLTSQTKEITTVAYLPDKKTLASASRDGTVKLWDAQTGALKQTVEEHDGEVVSLAFSSDGTTAAVAVVNSGGGGMVFINDMQGGQLGAVRQKIERANIQSVAFAPDGKTLAVGNTSGSLTLWDTTTGTLKQTLEGQDIQTRAVTFSPDGKLVASAANHTINLWDVATGELRQTFKLPETTASALAFAPDGATLASGCADGTVKLWKSKQ